MEYGIHRRQAIPLPRLRPGEKYKEVIHDDFDIYAFMNYLPSSWKFAEDMNHIKLPGWQHNGKYHYTDNIERDLELIRERDDVYIECTVGISLCLLYLLRYTGHPLPGRFYADNRLQVNDWFMTNLRSLNPRAVRVRLKYTLGCGFYLLQNFLYEEIFKKYGIPTSYQGENSLCIDGKEIAFIREGFGSNRAGYMLTNIDYLIMSLKKDGKRVWENIPRETRALMEQELKKVQLFGKPRSPTKISGPWSDYGVSILDNS